MKNKNGIGPVAALIRRICAAKRPSKKKEAKESNGKSPKKAKYCYKPQRFQWSFLPRQRS